MYSLQRKLHSQNFLVNRELVKRLVRDSSIAPQDTVLEIGAGRGIITQELVIAAKEIIALEIDRELVGRLRTRFKGISNLQLIEGDFLDFRLPQQPYKVFASIPFSITGEIVRKLLQSAHPPADCYLVVQTEAADKFTIHPESNTMAAMLYYPWWDIQITHTFRRVDFAPAPQVDCVLLHCQPRSALLIGEEKKAAYFDFVAYQFMHGFSAKYISPSRWLKLFMHHDPRITWGSFAELQRQQSRLSKIHRTRTDKNWKRQ